MRWSWLVVVIALAARGAWAETIFPWPAPLPDRAWRVGQWLHYTSSGGDEYVAVVGEDACGTWIEWTTVKAKLWDRWTVCFDDDDQPVMAIRSRDRAQPYNVDLREPSGTKTFLELRLRPLITPPDALAAEHQAIELPVGRFEQAVHDATDAARWFHPSVPLAGFIKGHELSLVGFGTSRTVARDLSALREETKLPVPRTFFSLGAGWDRVAGRTGKAADTGGSFRWSAGFRASQRVDFVSTVGSRSGQDEDHFLARFGVEWSPFRAAPAVQPPPIDVSALSLRAELGYAEILRDDDTAGRGLGLDLTVRWLLVRRLGWALGFELGGDVAFYGSGEGSRRVVWLGSVVQLFGFP